MEFSAILTTMRDLIEQVWFLKRDLVSEGFNQALDYIKTIVPLHIHEIPSGTKCWTWTVPEQWSVGQAYVETMDGKRLIDVRNHPLHVLSYSLPKNGVVSREELLKHLHTRPDRPNAIPYEFKYYERDWGFCIPHNKLDEFTDKEYRVKIDAKFEQGAMKIGDCTIQGETEKTIVLIAHLCHPAQVNDDLSGVAVALDIAKKLLKQKNYYTYKILLLPETIGSIAFLSQNEHLISKVKFGIFLEMLGNDDCHSLQRSRQGNTLIDRVAQHVLQTKDARFRQDAFRKVVRNDEMVWNGPGVNIPTISISRAQSEFPHFPEYHTSDDNPSIISYERLEESKQLVFEMIRILDANYTPKRSFKGPVFLSGHGLWVDWRVNRELNKATEQIMLNMEGDKTIFDIAELVGLNFFEVKDYVDKFLKQGLVIRAD